MRDEVKELYPALKDVEQHTLPTPVHLQVYDGISALCPASRA